MSDPEVGDLLRTLEQHELAMARLYSVYSQKLPDMSGLWDQLVLEEKAHADVLQTLREQLEERHLAVNTRKFNATAVRMSMRFIDRDIVEIRSRGTTALRALSVARGIEHAVIEKEFFTVYESDTDEMKAEFQELNDHTARHRKLLEDRLAAEEQKRA